jgi:type IV pilus assembly protein PilA
MSQRGFSIVEMMIVVGIIGAIAAFAFPLYNNYITRSKVSEPLTLLTGLKNSMAEYYLTWERWPEVEEVGGKITGRYTSIVASGGPEQFDYNGSNAEGFYVEATMKPDANIGGKQIRLAYILESHSWICTLQGVDDPIPDEYLPTSCR